jgi:hypothetical protein
VGNMSSSKGLLATVISSLIYIANGIVVLVRGRYQQVWYSLIFLCSFELLSTYVCWFESCPHWPAPFFFLSFFFPSTTFFFFCMSCLPRPP